MCVDCDHRAKITLNGKGMPSMALISGRCEGSRVNRIRTPEGAKILLIQHYYPYIHYHNYYRYDHHYQCSTTTATSTSTTPQPQPPLPQLLLHTHFSIGTSSSIRCSTHASSSACDGWRDFFETSTYQTI